MTTTTPPTSDSLDVARQQLLTHGYAVIRGAIPDSAVEDARAICDQHLTAADKDAENEIEASKLLRIPELASIVFNATVCDSLRDLIGGPVTLYPNYVVRLNRFTDWHIDNGFLPQYHEDGGHLFDPDFRHLQCVAYFQDNIPGVGGGLDVVPGSHRWAEQGVTPEHETLFTTYGEAIGVDTRAGDLLVFDGRLLHRGSPSEGALPKRKYGVFWSASRSDDLQVERYLRYLAGRSDHLRELGLGPDRLAYMVRRYDDVLSVTFPSAYLDETVAFVEQHDVRIASIG